MVFSTPKEALKMILRYILLGCLHKFSLDPFYELLPWFMISLIVQCMYMCIQNKYIIKYGST